MYLLKKEEAVLMSSKKKKRRRLVELSFCTTILWCSCFLKIRYSDSGKKKEQGEVVKFVKLHKR